VNGNPIEEVKEWFTAHTSYVLQLAVPYYEELTARENLMLASHLRLPKEFTMEQKAERVEQVIADVSGGDFMTDDMYQAYTDRY